MTRDPRVKPEGDGAQHETLGSSQRVTTRDTRPQIPILGRHPRAGGDLMAAW
ncbi:MAG: hypothetical protein ACNA7F_07845 [Roseovarius sp.]